MCTTQIETSDQSLLFAAAKAGESTGLSESHIKVSRAGLEFFAILT